MNATSTVTAADPTRPLFVSYIDRTREYYRAQGFERPYRWACFDQVPFTPLARPLAQSLLTLVTTVDPWREPQEPRAPRRLFSVPSRPPPIGFDTEDRAWDKESTHTGDLDSYFPIHRLLELEAEGRIGGMTPRLHSVPTSYSHRDTMERDAPELLRRCREDGAAVALFCPL